MASKTESILRQFVGTACVCGQVKESKHAFCFRCYRSLPPTTQRSLWKRFGQGFEDAYVRAEKVLLERSARREARATA